MSENPTTSTAMQYPETKRYLQRVFKKLLTEARKKDRRNLIPALKITGLTPQAQESIEKGETLDLTTKPIDRYVIHKQLFHFYLLRSKLPTTRQLFNSLSNVLPVHMDISSFRKLLCKMDYGWKKITPTLYVVMERPEVTYERISYLKPILKYHEENVPIYFVEEWIIPMDSDSRYDTKEISGTAEKERVIFAFSGSEIVFRNSILSKNSSEVQYKNWIFGELIPSLEKESVIVMNTEHYYTDLFNYPTINSLKVDMTDWLDSHNVPYDVNMSKVELYTLIEKFTDVDSKTTTLDKIILSHGHIPMRIPRHMHMMSPGYYLYEHIKEDLDFFNLTGPGNWRDKINSQMNSVDVDIFDKYINESLMKYKSLLCDDLVFDEKIDFIINSRLQETRPVRAIEDEDSDLPLDSDSD